MSGHRDEYPAGRPNRPPTPPGAILRNTVLPALNMKPKQAADELRVSKQTLHKILNGSAISPEMALRLGKFCGNGPDLWLNMQHKVDLWSAKQKLGKELEKIPEHRAAA
jgi:addiction module HigA family antidote